MFEIKDKVEDIVNNVEAIANTYYQLSVVKVADKGSNVGASLIIVMFLFGLFLFALLFACLGISWWVGERLQRPYIIQLIQTNASWWKKNC